MSLSAIPEYFISFRHLRFDAVDCVAIGYFIYNKYLSCKEPLTLLVDLTYCNLGDTEIEILLKYVRKGFLNKDLGRVQMFLRNNRLGLGAITALSDTLIQSSQLVNVDLDGCLHPATMDTKSALKYLIEGLSRNTSLKILSMQACSLGPSHAYHLALLCAICKTESLSLSGNNIRSSIPFIAETIKYNRALKELRLDSCYISDRELILLGEALQQNDALEELFIAKNPFSSSTLTVFRNGLIGTKSRLRINLNVGDHLPTDLQRHTTDSIRLQQTVPPVPIYAIA